MNPLASLRENFRLSAHNHNKSPGNLMDQIASDLARANMIEQQIRPCEVLDDRVLDAMNSIPREEFVAAEYVDLAFTDTHVPLQDGELMMKPIQEGAMLQALTSSRVTRCFTLVLARVTPRPVWLTWVVK